MTPPTSAAAKWVAAVLIVFWATAGAGCLDNPRLSHTPEARKVFLTTFNNNAPEGCRLTGAGGLTAVTYVCDGRTAREQRTDLEFSCPSYAAIGFRSVTLGVGDDRLVCDVTAACACQSYETASGS